MFNQTFEIADLLLIAPLVLLEGVLSIDNAVVLGLIAGRLPRHLQRKVLSYGLAGALVFRLLAILSASLLLRFTFVKLVGGLYLLYLAGKKLLLPRPAKRTPTLPSPGVPGEGKESKQDFWATVLAVEMTDIAFAIDSILAAIALVSQRAGGNAGIHPKLWIVLVGGMLGVVLVRYAASLFARLLKRFANLEWAAYLLVAIIGVKLVLEFAVRADFGNPHSPWFWSFWSAMAVALAVGLVPRRRDAK